jgi:hypothetical protein
MSDHIREAVSRVRAWASDLKILGNPMAPDLRAILAALSDAETQRDALAERVRVLEGALKPLADCEIIEPDVPLPDGNIARYPFTMGEFIDVWSEEEDGAFVPRSPTHWMPLPTPPFIGRGET